MVSQVKRILKRLLFVDDEPNIRATLPIILRRYGFTVTVAATASEALEHIENREFDLLLCDLNIEQERDGFDVIRAMHAAHPRCINIVLTGYPDMNSAVEGIHLGIDDYILKPAKADTLVAILADKLAAIRPKARILNVGYDEPVLRTWALLLEAQGYEVVTASGFSSLDVCKQERFDVVILGRSVPQKDKKAMVEIFRQCCPVPMIAVPSNSKDQVDDGADYHIEPDPEALLKTIADVIAQKSTPKPPLHNIATQNSSP